MTEQEIRDQIARLEGERAAIDEMLTNLKQLLARQMAATMVDHYVVNSRQGLFCDFATYEEAVACAIEIAGEDCQRQGWYYFGPEGDGWKAYIKPIFADCANDQARFILEHFC